MQKIKTNLILRLVQFGEHPAVKLNNRRRADIAFIWNQNHLLAFITLLHWIEERVSFCQGAQRIDFFILSAAIFSAPFRLLLFEGKCFVVWLGFIDLISDCAAALLKGIQFLASNHSIRNKINLIKSLLLNENKQLQLLFLCKFNFV